MSDQSLRGTKVLLGVSGSIAAYKAPQLLRELLDRGAEVRVVMTPSATQFVPPLTLQNLSKYPVVIDMFDSEAQAGGSWHIHLAHWCTLMMIAPCSATSLGKLAAGIADTALTALALALPPARPLIIAPAMDSDMWQHPATQRNAARLREDGAIVVPPEEGELASGLTGPGRLPANPTLLDTLWQALKDFGSAASTRFETIAPDAYGAGGPEEMIRDALSKPSYPLQEAVDQDVFDAAVELERLKAGAKRHDETLPLHGKCVLITAGPTYERIDDVRFIANRSSGKMGFALASEAAALGADVTLVTGPVELETPEGVRRIDVESAEQMFSAAMTVRDKVDAAVFAAAVADFTPSAPAEGKIKKDSVGDTIQLVLKRTPDILAAFGATKREGQKVIGFALEAEQAEENARVKLQTKKADLIVLNKLGAERSGFGGDDNTITIVRAGNAPESFPAMSKQDCAVLIWRKILQLYS